MWQQAAHTSIMWQQAAHTSIMWQRAAHTSIMWQPAAHTSIMWQQAAHTSIMWQRAAHTSIMWQQAAHTSIMWLNKSHRKAAEKMARKEWQEKNGKTERAIELGRKTREDIAKGDQTIALRFQTRGARDMPGIPSGSRKLSHYAQSVSQPAS